MGLPTFSDRYRVILEVGRGGMADVWLAAVVGGRAGGELSVVKCLRQNVSEDADFVAMFRDEARLASRLDHPNVVRVTEVGEANDKTFLAMEYLDGQPLHRILARAVRRGETFPQNMWLRVLADALAGLHYAHELRSIDGAPVQIVHRDVTPENVFVTYDGAIKLVDFGIAKAVGRTVETKMGVVKGKIAYLSPEQAHAGRLEIDRRTDIFAVGIMIWEAATLRRFWAGCDDLGIINRLVHGRFDPSPRAVEPRVAPALDAICRRALAPNANERYATAAELRADLEAFIVGTLGEPSRAELGAWVAERFAKERRIVQEAIDAALKEVAALPPRTPTPPPPPATAAPARSAVVEPPPSSKQSAARPSPKRRPPAIVQPLTFSRRRRVSPTVLLILAAGFGLAGVSLLVFALGNLNRPASKPQNEKVSLRISAAPDEATFRIDDGLWLSNPAVATVDRDAALHELRVEAPGYAPETLTVEFREDQWIRVALARSVP